MSSPLSGLKVLDLSRFIAGPLCAMLLGDLGADVLKVERPRTGEDARLVGPYIGEESIYFMMFNRNKRSMTLDFRNPRSQALLRDLAAKADVLVENFRPGTMEKMGCGWEDLRAINPRLVMARLSGYGQNNSMTSEPCFDGIAQAISGIMDLTGQPDGRPTMAGTFLVDYATGQNAAVGVLAALNERHRTRQGQMVDVSLVGGATSMLMTAIPEFLVKGREMKRTGNRDRYVAPANTFRTADDAWIHIVGGSDVHFRRLARMMDRQDLLDDPRFATLPARLENVEAIEAVVADWASRHTAQEVLAALRVAELPNAKVRSISEVAGDPYMREAGHIVDVVHPTAGTVPMSGPTIRLSSSEVAVNLPPPTLGEHTAVALETWLGLTEGEIDDLRDAAAI